MEAGVVIGAKYHVVQLVGQGGMGAVYDAVNAKTGRRVALKLIKEHGIAAGSSSLTRFAREVKAAGAIDSLYVVQVLDAGEDEASGMPYLVMEYLQGEDLRAVLARGPLSPDRAVAIAIQVCRGLVKAHAADIVHRDLKPANLFLAEVDGGKRIVKILDFGIAKLLHEEAGSVELTSTGDVVGSPPYMSPEQLASPRDVDYRSDLWSLGVVLYEMLSGAVPTAGISPIGARAYAICNSPAPPLAVPAATPELLALVHRALALDPKARFASAEEMLDALSALHPSALERDEIRPTTPAEVLLAPASGRTQLELAATERDRPRRTLSARARWGTFGAAVMFTVGALLLQRRIFGTESAGAELTASARAPEAPSEVLSALPSASASAGPSSASTALGAVPPPVSPPSPPRSTTAPHLASGGARKSGTHRGKTEASAASAPAPKASMNSTGREQL
jgi:eukaryotic-like serine/threonine-protein kinase